MRAIDSIAEALINRLQTAIDNNESFTWVRAWKGHVTGNALRWLQDPEHYEGYRGINSLIYECLFLTYKQTKILQEMYPDRKIHVKKGAKASPIFFGKYVQKKEEDDDDESEKSNYYYYTSYPGFPLDCIAGIEGIFDVKQNDDEKSFDMLEADRIIGEYVEQYGISIEHLPNSSKCVFYPDKRLISVPPESAFVSLEEYYSAIFHEVIHSTSIPLDLKLKGRESIQEYSKEELRAEIGSQILCSYLGMNKESVQTNSIAYLRGWLKYLHGATSSEIVWIANAAVKAASLVLNKVDEELSQESKAEESASASVSKSKAFV